VRPLRRSSDGLVRVGGVRRPLLPLSLLIAAVVLAGCTGEPAPSRPGGTVDDNTTMTLADSAEPSTLNPIQGFAPYGGSRMYDGLVDYTAGPSFPSRLVLGVIPHTALPTDPRPPGTGAYAVSGWDKGKQLVLGLNKNYYGVPPKVVKVTVVFVPDDATRIDRMKVGDFDGIEVPPQQAVAVAKFDGVHRELSGW
jgi:ABC-type transport system substrate-binding protein